MKYKKVLNKMRLLMAADAPAAYPDHKKRFVIYVGPQIGMNPIALWGLPDLEY
jgi:hypothetical protein